MVKIQINKSFQDKYTGTLYEVGKVIEVEEKRLEELKDFDNDLVSVIEEVKPKKDDKKSKIEKPVDEEPSKDDTSKENEEK